MENPLFEALKISDPLFNHLVSLKKFDINEKNDEVFDFFLGKQ